MHDGSQQAITILRALADAVTRLDAFGYNLYLQRCAPSRIPCRTVSTGGHPFKIGHEEFERGYIFGSGIHIDPRKERSVVFTVIFAWNADEWFVQSMIEEEDGRREQCTRALWESPQYRIRSLPEVLTSLAKAIDGLEASLVEKSVGEVLDAISKP